MMIGYLVQVGPDGLVPTALQTAADNVCALFGYTLNYPLTIELYRLSRLSLASFRRTGLVSQLLRPSTFLS